MTYFEMTAKINKDLDLTGESMFLCTDAIKPFCDNPEGVTNNVSAERFTMFCRAHKLAYVVTEHNDTVYFYRQRMTHNA